MPSTLVMARNRTDRDTKVSRLKFQRLEGTIMPTATPCKARDLEDRSAFPRELLPAASIGNAAVNASGHA